MLLHMSFEGDWDIELMYFTYRKVYYYLPVYETDIIDIYIERY